MGLARNNTEIFIVVDSLEHGHKTRRKVSEKIEFVSLFKQPLTQITLTKVKKRLQKLSQSRFNKKSTKLVFVENPLAYNVLTNRNIKTPISDADMQIKKNNKYVAISGFGNKGSIYDAFLHSKLLIKKNRILNATEI